MISSSRAKDALRYEEMIMGWEWKEMERGRNDLLNAWNGRNMKRGCRSGHLPCFRLVCNPKVSQPIPMLSYLLSFQLRDQILVLCG